MHDGHGHLAGITDFECFARLVHELGVQGHVAHPPTPIKLDAIEAIRRELTDVALIINVPAARWLVLLDAAAAVEIPTHLEPLFVAVVDKALHVGEEFWVGGGGTVQIVLGVVHAQTTTLPSCTRARAQTHQMGSEKAA
jgi:hypothetical protein